MKCLSDDAISSDQKSKLIRLIFKMAVELFYHHSRTRRARIVQWFNPSIEPLAHLIDLLPEKRTKRIVKAFECVQFPPGESVFDVRKVPRKSVYAKKDN